MNAAPSPLAALRDVHLPDPVALWPPAPGWWIGALLVVALLAWQGVRLWRRTRSPERLAGRILADIETRYRKTGDSVGLSTDLSRLLRRLSLARFARSEVAGVHGAERARQLAGGGADEPVPGGLIERLETVVYAGPAAAIEPDEPEAWIDATRRLIRRKS